VNAALPPLLLLLLGGCDPAPGAAADTAAGVSTDAAANAAAEPAQAVEPAEEEVPDLRAVGWNGVEVSSVGYLEDAELRFTRAGKRLRTVRDEAAHHWALFPPADLTGDGVADLQAWFWSGGAHCCFTTIVFPGRADGKVPSPGSAWRLDHGDSQARPFRTVPEYPRPVLAVWDTSAAYLSGAFAESPAYPYFVEAGADGLRLAAPLMASARPGEGPAALTATPSVYASLLPRLGALQGVEPPARRLASIRGKLDAAFAAAAPAAEPAEVIARASLLPVIERHIKLHCVYDESCDIAALAAEVEGERKGALAAWARELQDSWTGSSLYRLKRRR
jgi:hypothetical protein